MSVAVPPGDVAADHRAWASWDSWKIAFLMGTPAWCWRRAAELGESVAAVVAALMEVAPDDAENGDSGRTWIVRMRRNHHSVFVARGLGRLSGHAYAREIRWFFDLSREGGGAIWDVPAAKVTPAQARVLHRLLGVSEGARLSDLERLRKGPRLLSGKGMTAALAPAAPHRGHGHDRPLQRTKVDWYKGSENAVLTRIGDAPRTR